MQTEDKDWGRIYPNIIKWTTNDSYHTLSWIRFWREGNEYQLPVRMTVEGVRSSEEGAVYDEEFHKRCLDIIRFGKAHGDFKEPIKFNDKHVITINYDDIQKEDRGELEQGDDI